MVSKVEYKSNLTTTTPWVSFAVIFMAIGTVAELLLLSHFEDAWQVLPIALISMTVVVFLVLNWKRIKWIKQLYKILLVACVLSGGLGMYFHLQTNMEFEAELHPTQPWTTTFMESLSGALPALAPGSMVAFALMGYIYLLLINKQYNNESID